MSVMHFKRVDATWPQLRARHREANRAALEALFADQRRTVVARVRSGNRARLDADTLDRLTGLIYTRNRDTAETFGRRVEAELVGKQFEPSRMDRYLQINAGIAAGGIIDSVDLDLAEGILDGADGVEDMFETILSTSVTFWATSMVTLAANFGAHEGAKGGGAANKTWQVNSGNPRSSHAALAGATVGVDDAFANGMLWPGDPSGGAEELAGCQCSLVYV